MKKYIVREGFVRIKDGEKRIFVSANTLMRLYGVKSSECKIQSMTKVDKELNNNILIVLTVRADGKYKEYIKSIHDRRKRRLNKEKKAKKISMAGYKLKKIS